MNTDWIEDWFGSEYYSLLYKHRSAKEAQLFLDKLIHLLNIGAESHILDCGCGKGRHSIYLSKKGFNVTGVDVSKESISESIIHAHNKLNFYIHDLRTPFRINYFNIAISLFTSFGYFDSDYENNRIIKSISSSLKPNGLFVLDFMNTEKEIAGLVPKESFLINNIQFNISRSITRTHCIEKEIMITDKETMHQYRENVKAYTLPELKTMLLNNHLEVESVWGDYVLSPFNIKTSNRLIIIARKK